MPETPERLANRLADEGLRSQQFFGALSPAQWERALYTDGMQWTVRQVFAHFVITEVGIRSLMANILTGGDGAPQDFDLNAFNERQVTKWGVIPPDDLLARFGSERQATVEWVRGLAPGDLLKTGRHPWLGVAPLEEMIQLMYRHNQIHQRDIRKLFAEG
jgi:hypothetical protein